MSDLLLQPNAAAQTASGNVLVIQSGDIDPHHEYTELWMPGGQVFRVSTGFLTTAADVDNPKQSREHSALLNKTTESVTIPVIEEKLIISKRVLPTATVQIHKTVQSYQQTVDEQLAVQTFDVEHVAINLPVEAVPSVRQEGDTTIYPLVEEQLVLMKQLILKEEVRITRCESKRQDTRVVTLKREKLSVVRTPVERSSPE